MDINNPARKSFQQGRLDHAHIACKHDKLHLRLFQKINHTSFRSLVQSGAEPARGDEMSGNSPGAGQVENPGLLDIGNHEADLRRHLVQQAKIKDEVLEADDTPDPRFLMTAAELEKKGIKDYQLDYALKTLKRLGPQPVNLASKSGR